jgi:glycosyltransferase involved in cell wall biosynthesis
VNDRASARPMRVALVAFYPADPARISGGIRAVTHQLVEGFRRRPELDVHVIHCHSDITEDRTETRGNITAYFLALPKRRVMPNMVTALDRIGKQLRAIRPDVVNAHNPSYAVASLRAGYRPVWTSHGVTAEEARYNPGLFNRLAFALAARYEREALAGVREMTAISPYIRQRFERRTAARWHLTENPAPEDLFQLDRAPIPGRLLLPASVIPRKDILTLVEAVALARLAMPHLHLLIAGRTNETAYVQQVKDACDRFGVSDNIHLLGAQGHAQMRQHYREAQLVVLSSREEVSPMSLIEALAAGIPVVTTAAGGAGFTADDGVTGRVVPVGDARAFADALCEVLGDARTYERMSAAARPAAQRRFRLDRVVDAYLAAYTAALEGQ